MKNPKCFAHRYKNYKKCAKCNKDIATACWIATVYEISEATGNKFEMILKVKDTKNVGG